MAVRMATFSKRLRTAIDMRGISQTELAKKTGISKSSISHYLKGDWEGKQDAVYALALALNVSEAWLMGFDAKMERGNNLTAPHKDFKWVAFAYVHGTAYFLRNDNSSEIIYSTDNSGGFHIYRSNLILFVTVIFCTCFAVKYIKCMMDFFQIQESPFVMIYCLFLIPEKVYLFSLST